MANANAAVRDVTICVNVLICVAPSEDKEAKPGLTKYFQPAVPKSESFLLKLIANKHMTFDVVESEDFRDYSRSLNSHAPIYTVRSVKDSMRLAMLKKRLGLERFMKERHIRKAAVTHDSWTSKGDQTYSSLSWHFISEEFDLYSCPFDIKKICGHTYASCIAETVNDMAEQRDIDPTVACTRCYMLQVQTYM